MPQTTQELISALIAAWAEFSAMTGGYLGTIGSTDIDTKAKAEAKRAYVVSSCEQISMTEAQELKYEALLDLCDNLIGTFAGGS